MSICPIADAVAADIQRRAEHGFRKYGTTLARQDLTEQEWRVHLYEELLDAAVYLKRLIVADEAVQRLPPGLSAE